MSGPTTPAPRQRRRRSDADRSVAAIIAAALDALTSDPDASMAEIARRAGVVRATIYVHFPTRESLLDAVMDHVIADVAAGMAEAEPQRGMIAVKASARVPSGADRKDVALYVALADSGLASDIKAGENAGAHLAHDHVVRWFRAGPSPDANGDMRWDVGLPLPTESGSASTIVAFVQNAKAGEVLQALALPLTAACAPLR